MYVHVCTCIASHVQQYVHTLYVRTDTCTYRTTHTYDTTYIHHIYIACMCITYIGGAYICSCCSMQHAAASAAAYICLYLYIINSNNIIIIEHAYVYVYIINNNNNNYRARVARVRRIARAADATYVYVYDTYLAYCMYVLRQLQYDTYVRTYTCRSIIIALHVQRLRIEAVCARAVNK